MVVTRQIRLPEGDVPLTARMPNLSYKNLRKVCSSGPTALAKKYGLTYYPTVDGGYWYKDNGSNKLAVAHLDSVKPFTHFDIARLRPDTLIFTPNLDDRLGVYIILDYLDQIRDVKYDILLTTNEENGASTAAEFIPPKGKKYSWMFMFDRVGTGCTVYNYRGAEWELALDDAGFSIHKGSYSCIADLGFLGCKGVNFGAGYHDNHSDYAVAMKSEIMQQIRHFLLFYEANAELSHSHCKADVVEYYAERYGPSKKTTPIYNLPVIGPKKKPKPKKANASDDVAKTQGKELQEYLKDPKNQNLSKLDRIKKWRAARDKKKTEEALETARKLEITIFNRIQTSLITEVGVMRIPYNTLTILYDNNILHVGELARMTKKQLLNLKRMRKRDVNAIAKALAEWDLDLGMDLSDYNITIHESGKGLRELDKAHQDAVDLDNAHDDSKKSESPIAKGKLAAQIVGITVGMPPSDIDVAASIKQFREDTGQAQKSFTQITPKTISKKPLNKGRIKAALSLQKSDSLQLSCVNKKWCWLAPASAKSEEEPLKVGFSHLRKMKSSELVKKE